MRITHNFVHQEIITLITEAQQFLILVSPYLITWPGLTTAIERARVRGVMIYMILRGGEDREKHTTAAAPLRPFLQSLRFIERLHAKIYLSEKAAVLTSMNLVETSALNSIEFAAFATKESDLDSYQQTYKICESLIATAEQDWQRESVGRAAGTVEPARTPPPKKYASSRRSSGHCIRCAEDITLNPDKPLCADCYKVWAKYEDANYEEAHCHGCGRKSSTSMRKPLCRNCYEAAA